MFIVIIMLLFGFSSELWSMSTTIIKRKLQPPTLTEQIQATFGNQIIQLTDIEYRQLMQLPSADRIINADRTVLAQDLFRLLSQYQLSRPTIYCIRAPCPQPVVISNDASNIEIQIPLTNSDFSEIIKSLNL